MTKEEVIKMLEDLAETIEWTLALHYQVAIEEAIRIIRESE